MTEGTDQMPLSAETHGVEMHIIRHVGRFVREVVGGLHRVGDGKGIELRIVDALPVPDHFPVIHLLQIGIDHFRALLVAGDVIDRVVQIAGQDVVVEVQQQEIVAVQRRALGGDVRGLEGDPLHFVEILVQDDPLARRVAGEPVIVIGARLVVVAVIGPAVHHMLLEVPPAGVCAFRRLLFVLRPYDVAFPVQHDQVAAEHEGKIEVSRKLGRSFDGNLGEPVRHDRRFRRGGGQSEAAPDSQRKSGRRHEDRFSYSVHRYILPFLCAGTVGRLSDGPYANSFPSHASISASASRHPKQMRQ